MPDVRDNVHLIKGMVQDTVPDWQADHPGRPVIFAHLDMDTYAPTRFVLNAIRPLLRPGTALLSDELYG